MTDEFGIGIIIDTWFVELWDYNLILDLLRDDLFKKVLIIKKNQYPDKSENNSVNLILKWYRKIDKLIFTGIKGSISKRDLRRFIDELKDNKVSLKNNHKIEIISLDEFDKLKESKLQIIIKLCYGSLPRKILDIPVFGVLTYSAKNYNSADEDIKGIYEVANKIPVIGEEIIIFKSIDEENIVISRIYESTCRYSISMTREKLFSRISKQIPNLISHLCLNGQNYLNKLESNYSKNDTGEIRNYVVTSLSQSINIFLELVLILVNQVIKKILFTDPFSWILLYKISSDNDFRSNDYQSFTIIKPSKDKFWADPFVIKEDDKFLVFVEEFIYKKNKGHISVLEIDNRGKFIRSRMIIEKQYHMSYPLVFINNGVYYMIPETSQNRTIDLYRCDKFPYRWEYFKTIMSNVNAVDSTLFHYNDIWWLFTVIDTINNPLGAAPELYLFYCKDFTSEDWNSHPLNPVVSDVRTARPAGRIFIEDGIIYRPSQDCAGTYGNSIEFNRIMILSENDYKEEAVQKIKPDWNKKLKGAHTFNFDSDFTIIDAYSLRRRFN